MISIILLLLSSHHVAFGGLLAGDSGCITSSKQPNPVDCHQLISAFSQNDASGYITLEGRQILEMAVGTCAGTLFNKQSTKARVNTGTLAFDMTNKVYNQCVINGMWGRSETDQYSIHIWYLDPKDARSPFRHNAWSTNNVALPAKHKRGAAGTTSINN
ncbi:hypothetical protein N657DRAFT_681940 [Parathielavia appendiculata]|uniref:Uncharacterized protein n=1 Tax=Parathielavia appendiculata TaxID=2587402 RepID=A0AAN6TWM6_9PEZI|nr:hypothetical protein N657DRAFT_681940 [Parathielavia appendiculata]